jgi:hypothetical protein
MQRQILLIAALLVSSVMWNAANGIEAEPPYSLVCTSLWTKLNHAPLTIKTEPFTDTFWIDAEQKTVNGVPAEFTKNDIGSDHSPRE